MESDQQVQLVALRDRGGETGICVGFHFPFHEWAAAACQCWASLCVGGLQFGSSPASRKGPARRRWGRPAPYTKLPGWEVLFDLATRSPLYAPGHISATPGHKLWIFLSAIYWSFICFLIVHIRYMYKVFFVKRYERYQIEEKNEKGRLQHASAPLTGRLPCSVPTSTSLRSHFFTFLMFFNFPRWRHSKCCSYSWSEIPKWISPSLENDAWMNSKHFTEV